MVKVLITGWQVGLQKISMTKLIQEHTLLSLSQAKSVTDRVLNDEAVILSIDGYEEAENLVDHLKKIRANAQVVQE